MKTVAIITARGGSKRIPRKNIREFMGRPMIAYAIDASLRADIFDTVMVSTDDAEIADISRGLGAEVPFMRSEETANDFATTADVLCEVLDNYKKLGKRFDNLCCIYPAFPSRRRILKSFKNFRPRLRFPYARRKVFLSDTARLQNRRRGLRSIANRVLGIALARFTPTYHDAECFIFQNGGVS